MHLVAPQYPGGLDLEIYAYTVEGDLDEINTLNHYIGMSRIDRTTLSDLDWIPFALGALILLALRVAAVGDVRSLIDLLVISSYFGVFSLARFYYRLYVFGHNLDDRAPFELPEVGDIPDAWSGLSLAFLSAEIVDSIKTARTTGRMSCNVGFESQVRRIGAEIIGARRDHADCRDLRPGVVEPTEGRQHDCQPDGGADRLRSEPRLQRAGGSDIRRRRL